MRVRHRLTSGRATPIAVGEGQSGVYGPIDNPRRVCLILAYPNRLRSMHALLSARSQSLALHRNYKGASASPKWKGF